MKSASPNISARDNTGPTINVEVISEDENPQGYHSSTTVDVTPAGENHQGSQSASTSSDSQPPASDAPSPAPGSALTVTQGNFSSFLTHLNKDNFKKVVTDVEKKLEVVNQTLGMLDSLLDAQGFDAILDEMLRSITLKTGELLGADRTTIWLMDEERNELWSIVAKGADGKPLELRIPASAGIAGEAATFKKVVNIPYDFYDDPRSTAAKEFDKRNGYRTYTMVVMPLLKNLETGQIDGEGDGDKELVAVVQLINKLKPNHDPLAPLEEKIDQVGFTIEDEQVFKEFAPSIRLILESSKSFYAATQRQRAASALMNAVNSLSKSSLDLEDTLKNVMDQAKELMNADRSTLWLIDHDKDQLWTKIPIGGELKEFRMPRTAGFAGIVAESGEPLIIPFDLYDDPRSKTSQETDQKTKYRTCSMLCMPVFNADGHLIGVTQLINKKKQGEFANYDPSTWPEAPEQWKSSFNRNDMEFMKAFNIQAGVALQNAKLFAEVQQQKKMQEDILRSLSNGVISTDKNGIVIAANDCAKELLGIQDIEGKPMRDLIHLKEGDFSKWFDAALNPKDDKDRQQYYPDQSLLSGASEHPQSINLSINSMTSVLDASQVNGALVVTEDISGEKEVKNLMYRYMTPDVAEALLASGDTGLGGKRKHVSVLFSDIRSYTTLTEKLQAEEVVAMLNSYFEEMVDAVFKYGGTLDKYIGDALMAVFGSPAPLEDHPWCAMQAAVEMRQRLAEFNRQRREAGLMSISIGMGIHSDEVVSGNIGSSKRMELTSIGDGVNLASRLEGTSKQYGTDIVISENTYRIYADDVYVRELDFITVKGKSEPVRIYELVGIRKGPLHRPLTEAQEQIIEHYHQGRKYYLQPVTQTLSLEEVEAALAKVKKTPKAELKKLSYKVEEQLLYQLKKLFFQVKKMSQAEFDEIPLEDLRNLLEPEILNHSLEFLKNLSELEMQALLEEKIKNLADEDVKRLLADKLKERAAVEIHPVLTQELATLSLDRVKKLLDEFKKILEPKAMEAFHQADAEFKKVLAVDPKNKAADLHVGRCFLYKDTPPDVLNWDGVWKLTEK